MKREPEPDCYDYIRNYYNVPAYIGVRVRFKNGGEGVIVPAKHSRHYVHIRRDGEGKSDVYHPLDGFGYNVVGRSSTHLASASTVDAVPCVEEPVDVPAR